MGERISNQRTTTRKKRPRVGVALSGGGLRGIAHIGVLKAFVQNNIPVDMIAGTSAGAIVAALYAYGYSPLKIEEFVLQVNPTDFVDFKVSIPHLLKYGLKWLFTGNPRVIPNGLIKGGKVEKYFLSLWQHCTMQETRIPLAVTAVDIISADTIFFTTPLPAKRTILNARYYHNVEIVDAVRASISIPGIFLPKKMRGMTLVDGGVKNNLPTDILNHMGAEIIIAVDLGFTSQVSRDVDSVSEILLRCIEIMGREVTLLKAEQYADIIIRPNVDYDDAHQIIKCIEMGERAAMEKIAAIKYLL